MTEELTGKLQLGVRQLRELEKGRTLERESFLLNKS
jgi:hypothetical protein